MKKTASLLEHSCQKTLYSEPKHEEILDKPRDFSTKELAWTLLKHLGQETKTGWRIAARWGNQKDMAIKWHS